MKLSEMATKRHGGDRVKAAAAGGITLNNFNQCVSRGYEVAELKDGGFVMLTKKTKIFRGDASAPTTPDTFTIAEASRILNGE